MSFLSKLSAVLVLSLSLGAAATTGTTEFNRLETQSASNLLSKAHVLLRQYGNVEDFKITQEVAQMDECVSQTQIRAKTICDKTAKTQKTTILAEGNGLLCKITDQAQNIKCVEKN